MEVSNNIYFNFTCLLILFFKLEHFLFCFFFPLLNFAYLLGGVLQMLQGDASSGEIKGLIFKVHMALTLTSMRYRLCNT